MSNAAGKRVNTQLKVLLVDFNNFARYPKLSIGYLAAVLRKAHIQVNIFSPLMAVTVHGTTREVKPRRLSLLTAKLNYLVATSRFSWVRFLRSRLAKRQLCEISRKRRIVIEELTAHIELMKPQIVMISTYLMNKDLCAKICAFCRKNDIPTLIGGPYFSQPEVIFEWVSMPGLSALIAGEVELDLPFILHTLIERGDLGNHAGVFVIDEKFKPKGVVASPLEELDSVPFPDYSDFEWNAFPNRIISVITGRGCGWGVCSFCSDVTSSSGRSFRSRSPDNVLSEISDHYCRHGVSNFVFVDLKLNSNIVMWRSIIAGIQSVAPGAQWVGSVHVGMESENGLSDEDLRNAAKAGCVRLTTGLESGSQRVSDLMKKGTRIEAISSFLKRAHSHGISCRCTMITGYPGETVDDIHASADFLANHSIEIGRVSLNRLQVMLGTHLHRSIMRNPKRFNGLKILQEDGAMAQIEHCNDILSTKSHRKAVMRLITEVHRINSRNLLERAREFEGVM